MCAGVTAATTVSICGSEKHPDLRSGSFISYGRGPYDNKGRKSLSHMTIG